MDERIWQCWECLCFACVRARACRCHHLPSVSCFSIFSLLPPDCSTRRAFDRPRSPPHFEAVFLDSLRAKFGRDCSGCRFCSGWRMASPGASPARGFWVGQNFVSAATAEMGGASAGSVAGVADVGLVSLVWAFAGLSAGGADGTSPARGFWVGQHFVSVLPEASSGQEHAGDLRPESAPAVAVEDCQAKCKRLEEEKKRLEEHNKGLIVQNYDLKSQVGGFAAAGAQMPATGADNYCDLPKSSRRPHTRDSLLQIPPRLEDKDCKAEIKRLEQELNEARIKHLGARIKHLEAENKQLKEENGGLRKQVEIQADVWRRA